MAQIGGEGSDGNDGEGAAAPATLGSDGAGTVCLGPLAGDGELVAASLSVRRGCAGLLEEGLPGRRRERAGIEHSVVKAPQVEGCAFESLTPLAQA